MKNGGGMFERAHDNARVRPKPVTTSRVVRLELPYNSGVCKLIQETRMSKVLHRTIILFATFCLSTDVLAQDAVICPPLVSQYGNRDYLDPANLAQIRSVERVHFTDKVRSLSGGATGSVIGDLEYLLNWFPNHHQALDALTRLAIRENTLRPRGSRASVDCRFQWASRVNPSDPAVPMIMGIFHFKRGQNVLARELLEQAAKIAPNDANVQYNLGLVLVKLKDYPAAIEAARRAYGLGFPLPGLKNALARAGHPISD